ncbi:MAG: hypothetical protein N4A39_03920 [Roseicyclus sp.]|nr:hypothetical protein [Roseicyclus sp.]
MSNYGEIIEGIADGWASFREALDSRSRNEELGIDQEELLPERSFSIAELQKPLVQLIELSRSVQEDAAIVWLVKDQFFVELEELKNILERLSAAVEAQGVFNGSNFVIQDPKAGTTNLLELIDNVDDALRNLFLQHYPWLLLLQDAEKKSFEKIFQNYSDAYEDLTRRKGTVTRQVNQVKQTVEEVKSLRKQVGEVAKKIDESYVETSDVEVRSKQHLAQIEADVSTSESAVSEVKSFLVTAEQLSEKVEAYKTDFEVLDKDMQERFDRIDRLSEQLQRELETEKTLRARIEAQLQEAEDMLSGATTAGLAREFAEYRDSLEDSLRGARKGFYFSIVLLSIFSLPLILMVVPPLAALAEHITGVEFGLRAAVTTQDSDYVSIVVEAGARLLLIFPFLWLTSFSAGRYSKLFKLKEHYAYKRSIAASVDGFKKQAPSYEDEIVVAAFHQLTFNPADRMDQRANAEGAPNPIWNYLVAKIQRRFDSVAE